jgi:hypothetical protein
MRVNAYLTITGILFGIMAIVHVLRLLTGWPAMLGEWQVPTGFSVSGALIGTALCVWSIFLLRGRS